MLPQIQKIGKKKIILNLILLILAHNMESAKFNCTAPWTLVKSLHIRNLFSRGTKIRRVISLWLVAPPNYKHSNHVLMKNNPYNHLMDTALLYGLQLCQRGNGKGRYKQTWVFSLGGCSWVCLLDESIFVIILLSDIEQVLEEDGGGVGWNIDPTLQSFWIYGSQCLEWIFNHNNNMTS